MQAKISIKMDRPYESGKHYLDVGGFEVVAGGKNYSFDFKDSELYVRDGDPSIIDWYLRNEDKGEFPETEELRKHLHEITEIVEAFVYTGEKGEPEIHPKELLSFRITDSGAGKRTSFPKSTKNVKCIPYSDKDSWLIDYEMKPALIKKFRYEN